jgi:hypothetical protein
MRREVTKKDIARWVAVIATLAIAGWTAGRGSWETCRVILPNVASKGTARVCEQPALTDVPVVAGLLFIFLLLLPDISEVTLPGGIGIKRQLEAQRQRQEVLEQRLSLVAQSQQAQASAVGNVLSLQGVQEMIEDAVATRVRLRELERAEAQREPPDKKSPAKLAQRERAEVTEEINRLSGLELLDLQRELVRRWRSLAPLVRVADSARLQFEGQAVASEASHRLAEIDDEQLERLVNWRDAYDGIIKTVNETRRAVVSDPDSLRREDVATVAALARELEESARELGLLDKASSRTNPDRSNEP